MRSIVPSWRSQPGNEEGELPWELTPLKALELAGDRAELPAESFANAPFCLSPEVNVWGAGLFLAGCLGASGNGTDQGLANYDLWTGSGAILSGLGRPNPVMFQQQGASAVTGGFPREAEVAAVARSEVASHHGAGGFSSACCSPKVASLHYRHKMKVTCTLLILYCHMLVQRPYTAVIKEQARGCSNLCHS